MSGWSTSSTEQLASPPDPVVPVQVCSAPPEPSAKATGRPLTAAPSVSVSRAESFAAEPFEIDVTRPNAASHLAYGAGGPHYCLGAYLARLELRTFFERFIPRVRSLEIAGDVMRAKTTFVATFKTLPVRMELTGG